MAVPKTALHKVECDCGMRYFVEVDGYVVTYLINGDDKPNFEQKKEYHEKRDIKKCVLCHLTVIPKFYRPE